MPCRECGASLLVHDGGGGGTLVCTDCGTLADPAQTVLADNGDHPHTRHAPLRTSRGWHLSQTKQDRDKKNTIAMSTFISAVLSRLNNPGLSPRAEAIFTQALAKGHYRWGRKAKLVAGASVAIALREARKSDSLRDVAFLLDDSPVSLARTFQSVVSLLDFSLASTDPAAHLPTLKTHLQSAIHPESSLPKPLVSVLALLSIQTAVHTATLLSQIVSHHSPPLAIANLPTPPTACALLILGLEAEARAPLPHLGELTRTLGTRFAISPGVISSRYKIMYDLIEELIRHVPWLDQFAYKTKGRGAGSRSKVPKRAIVAKGIKDVIQFHEEIWSTHTQKLQKVNLDLELDPGDFANEEEEGDGDDANALAISSSGKTTTAVGSPPLRKRCKVEKGNAMEAAARFLFDPLSSRYLDVAPCDGGKSLVTHLLTCSTDELVRAPSAPPTRLQMLATSRGGSTADLISDEELFAVGELEGLFRSEQEREALQPLFQLKWSDEIPREQGTVRHRNSVTTESKRGAKRVDMDVLNRLLGGHGVDDDDDDDGNDEDVGFLNPDDDDAYLRRWDDCARLSEYQTVMEDAELVGDWRPASPHGDDLGASRDDVGDRYEEEL